MARLEGDFVRAATTNKLHGDLMIEIIGRLPIKSIIRFKSVCRAWNVLFSSPIFTHHHSRMISSFAKTNNLSSLLVHTPWPSSHIMGNPPCPTGRNPHILSILLDRPGGNPIMLDLNPPFEGYLKKVVVVGSINGLVCLLLSRSTALSIVLWNPAIRKHSTLPKPGLFVRKLEARVVMGFAYDETNGCYKVIRMVYAITRLADVPFMVEIYNTATNSWRTIEGVSVPSVGFGFVDAVRGVPYWFGRGDEEDHFVSFDASAQDFRVHPVTSDDYNDNYGLGMGCYAGLKILGEHLVLVYYAKRRVPKARGWKVTRLEIRKVKKCGDGGGKDPFSIGDKLTIVPVPHLCRILGFWRNGEIIALDKDNALVSYDYDSTQVQYLPSHHTIGNQCRPRVYDYMESLVWPTSLG